MKRTILSILFVTTTLVANSCWNIQDDANFGYSELDNEIKFSFKDAKNCKKLPNVEVIFFGQKFITNKDGEIILPAPPENLDIKDRLIAKKDGYITLKQDVSTMVGTFSNQKFLMVKDIPLTKAMFVLSWGADPKDLDLHLRGDDFHISYRKKRGNQNEATLDRDAMDGFGPETITLNRLNKNKKYELFVYKFSNKGELDKSVNISVYTNGKLNKTVNLEKGFTQRCVKIATIKNNKVKYQLVGVEKYHCK